MLVKRITAILLALLIAAGIFIYSGCAKKEPEPTKPVSTQTTIGPLASASGPPPQPSQSQSNNAKNVILLIGDGMGFGQLTLGRIAKGNKPLTMDTMKNTGYVSTYPDDPNALFVTDSAAAGTAMATGVKTNNTAIGVDNSGKVLKNILEYAKEAGKATGLVTSSRLTDATPAAFAAHNKKRSDEESIAAELLKTAPDVMLGGGSRIFMPDSRSDKKDLVTQAKQNGYTVVEDAKGLKSANSGKLIGLLSEDKLPYTIDKNKDKPSLKDMSLKAIDILSKDTDGFFLMIEGARIDHACSAHDASAAAGEVLAFDEAVSAALEFAKKDGQTLIIVTADHETGGLSIGSQAQGMTFIQGMLGKQKGSIYENILKDFNWNSTPDFSNFVKENFGIENLSPAEQKDLSDAFEAEKTDRQKNQNFFGRALAALASARTNTGWTTREHSGNDVPIMAYGPSANAIGGHMDNTEIFKVMKEAMGFKN